MCRSELQTRSDARRSVVRISKKGFGPRTMECCRHKPPSARGCDGQLQGLGRDFGITEIPGSPTSTPVECRAKETNGCPLYSHPASLKDNKTLRWVHLSFNPITPNPYLQCSLCGREFSCLLLHHFLS